MKRDGVYRFNLQFPADTQEHIRVGEVLERLGKRKSSLVVVALGNIWTGTPSGKPRRCALRLSSNLL